MGGWGLKEYFSPMSFPVTILLKSSVYLLPLFFLGWIVMFNEEILMYLPFKLANTSGKPWYSNTYFTHSYISEIRDSFQG